MTAERARIERSYQRAMDIRDSTPSGKDLGLVLANENRYMRAYRKAYRANNADGFTAETRRYLKVLRALARDPR